MTECVFIRDGKCIALTAMKCKNCAFRKTRAELAAGRKKARERIESLPDDMQFFIRNQYHIKPIKHDIDN